jgi:hypothetical protein
MVISPPKIFPLVIHLLLPLIQTPIKVFGGSRKKVHTPFGEKKKQNGNVSSFPFY